jgi:hypothetical protein
VLTIVMLKRSCAHSARGFLLAAIVCLPLLLLPGCASQTRRQPTAGQATSSQAARQEKQLYEYKVERFGKPDGDESARIQSLQGAGWIMDSRETLGAGESEVRVYVFKRPLGPK